MTLSPGNINFTLCNGLAIYVGADWSVPVQISERNISQGSITDTPVDLTGLTGRCAIKKYAGADQAVALPTVEITDPENGMILISLSAEDTSNIIVSGNTWKDTTTYVYDVYLDDGTTGESCRILMGNVEVSPSVTDSNDHE